MPMPASMLRVSNNIPVEIWGPGVWCLCLGAANFWDRHRVDRGLLQHQRRFRDVDSQRLHGWPHFVGKHLQRWTAGRSR
jgi:hypothetical protein